MKKALILSLILGSSIVMLPTVEAKAAVPTMTEASAHQTWMQTRRRIRRGPYGRMRRVVTTTRTRRIGRYVYRETIRTAYLPNGRTRTTVTRRVRVANRAGIRY